MTSSGTLQNLRAEYDRDGYVVVEKRSKLKEEYNGLPQEKLKELRDRGEQITKVLEVPLVSYLGDCAPGRRRAAGFPAGAPMGSL